MWFGVLGLLTVRVGEDPVVIPSGKQRAVLAALLLRTGQVVSFGELAEIVWDGSPPRSSHATLKNYVKRLRQARQADRNLPSRLPDRGDERRGRPGGF
jgi:DNA-binding SARP family transcriptional activator